MKFKNLIENEDLSFQKMEELFYERTLKHKNLVEKYIRKILELKDFRIDSVILKKEASEHDDSKFEPPEYPFYVYINYKYYAKRNGKEYNPGPKIERDMRDASSYHVTSNKHHPQYWARVDNADNKKINAENMPFSYMACMIADWLAMNEELKGDIYEWVYDFVKKKCKFTDEQIDFIYDIIEKVK